MAITKKVTPTVKAAEKKTDVKVTEVKATPTKEIIETKAPEVKETPVKKAVEKKAPVKKAPAKKAPAKKTELKTILSVQFDGKDYSTDDLVKIAKDVWKYDLKKKVSELTSIEIYVKPEESKAYYVMNDEMAGSFDI